MHDSRLKGSERGFTIIELLAAMFILAIIMAGVVTVYQTFTRHTSSQDLLIEMQQNARAGLDIIQKDLLLLGYRVPTATTEALTVADSNRIEFRFVDVDPDTGTAVGTKLEFGTVDVGGIKYLYRQRCLSDGAFSNECTNGDSTERKKVIGYLSNPGVEFTYYKADGSPFSPTTPNERAGVRFVKVALNTESSGVLPTLDPPAKRTYNVATEVRIRNFDITSATANTVPPNPPTGLQAREARNGSGTRGGVCGRLNLKWTMGTEPDLAGYRVFFTNNSSTRSVTVPLSGITDDGTSYYYTLTGLNNTASTASTPTIYTIGLRAYDTSSNSSTLSAEVSGNPSPSSYDFDTGSDDTTINPSKPDPVTTFTAQDGAENQVALNWSYDTANNPDVVGFRVYRNSSSFTTYPLAESGAQKWIAGAVGDGKTADRTLTSTATAFTDTGTDLTTGLVGCETYYYAIAPVNCDPTLITDDSGSDPVADMYVAADYAGTCGDGTGPCIPGAGMPSVSGADTTPTDNTGIGQKAGDPSPYPYPELTARPGWKRILLGLTNPRITGADPVDPDFSHTFIAYRMFAADEDCTPAEICYPGDIEPDGTIVGPGSRIPDRYITDGSADISGKFTMPGGGGDNNFFFDSETQQSASPPELPNECPADSGIPCTYYFKAISFDRCGNPSEVTAYAQPLTTLCGDDPDAIGAPAVPSGGDDECCETPVRISWNDQSSVVDFAGYVVYRGTSSNIADATILSGTTDYPGVVTNYPNPYWPSNSSCPWGCGRPWFEDNNVMEGQTYYYFIRAMDCAYANDPLGDNDEDGNMLDYSANISDALMIGPITPGTIRRDEKCAGSGTCGQDLHREVLTGVSVFANNSTLPQSSYRHNTITLFMENTSAGPQTIRKASVKWVNSSAYLREIAIGGGRSTISPAVSTSIALSATTPSTDLPYTRQVSNFDITDVPISATERYIPITFTFLDGSGNPYDMRDDQIHITLDVMNDSTGTMGCVTYLTTDETDSGIVVPMGPTVGNSNDHGGVYQDNPDGVQAYAVPGTSGTNSVPISGGATDFGPVVARGGSGVTISTTVVSNSSDDTGGRVPMAYVKLYWVETALTQGSAPVSGYTEVSMTSVDGALWSGAIPQVASPPRRIWYYILAVDADGNYDRKPEIGAGYYTYDQKPFDPCDFTPQAPSGVQVHSIADGNAAFKWERVSRYTSGDLIDAADSIVYQVWRKSGLTGSFQKVYEVPNAPTPAGWVNVASVLPATSSYYIVDFDWSLGYGVWWDYVDALNNDLSYYIVAENSCSADANTSERSSIWRECLGSTDAQISVNTNNITAGGSYEVTVSDCALASNAIQDTITIGNASSPGGSYALTLTETSATSGYFTGTVATYRSGSGDLYVLPADTANATVTVSCSSGCSGSPTSQTISVAAAACDYVPSAPASLTAVQGGANINLLWTANPEPDVSTYRIYRDTNGGGYQLVGQVSAGATTYADKPGQIATNDYSYYITAVDSCAQESSPSNTVGPF